LETSAATPAYFFDFGQPRREGGQRLAGGRGAEHFAVHFILVLAQRRGQRLKTIRRAGGLGGAGRLH
jgi:hypothetical protein